MGRWLRGFLAIFFPWIILFAYDNPVGAFAALVLQATVIGWIPASIWAWNTIHTAEEKPAPKKKKKA